MTINFTPAPDVAVLLNHLLDIFERRDGQPKQVVRVQVATLRRDLPGYYSQTDPTPRVTANEQVRQLAGRGYISLTWEPNQVGHLLETVTRHLLHCLAEGLAANTPLLVWADIDYGGLRILAHLRQQVSPRFELYLMDAATLEQYAHWGHPLSETDKRNLSRLRQHAALEDMTALIDEMLLHELKLEQEAVTLS